ncbi:MAG: DUF6516 family protein [Steroidobacterales bacterium]
MSNIVAELLLRERLVLSQRAFVEIVIWRLPAASRGSQHGFKYRLAYVANGRCVLQLDNEAGKGDHMHVEDVEVPYAFTDLQALQADFWRAVSKRRRGK